MSAHSPLATARRIGPATGLAVALAVLASAAAAAAPPYEHKTIPGAAPEPVAGAPALEAGPALEAFVDGVVNAHLKQNRLAGAQVAIVKDGRVVLLKGYGWADIANQVPVDPQRHLFRPGSVSKMFTWIAALQLVEQGKVDLDGDVNQYLRQCQIPPTFDAPITLRNLLTHTPGLEDGAVGYLFVRKPEQLQPLAEALCQHMPARVRPPTTDFSDGSNASYSNWGTALAGLIVENVSGQSFDDYVDQNILQPLGMSRSTTRQPVPAALAADLATGYAFKNGVLEPAPDGFEVVNLAPAGSLSATAADMARFMIANLNLGELGGRRILKEETARLMQSRQFSPDPHVNGSGLGFFEWWVNGRRFVSHWGDTRYFHTAMDLLPEERLGVYVVYNASNGQGPGIARRDLLRALMDRYYPVKLPRVAPPADFKERAGRYAGKYKFNRHSYTKVEKVFGLAGAINVAPTRDGTLVINAGGESNQWVEIAPNVFRMVDRDDTIAFYEKDGRITGMTFPLAFIAAYKLAWHQNPALHWLILGAGVLGFVLAIVAVLRHRRADRDAPPTARRARRIAALLALVQLLFLLALAVILGKGISEIFFGFPPSFRYALALPLLAVPLTLAVLYFAFRVWREGLWTGWARLRYGLFALAATAYLWSLHYWNLVGYKFG